MHERPTAITKIRDYWRNGTMSLRITLDFRPWSYPLSLRINALLDVLSSLFAMQFWVYRRSHCRDIKVDSQELIQLIC